MGTPKPGSPATSSLADLSFYDGFRVPYYHKNDLSRFYGMDLREIYLLSPDINFSLVFLFYLGIKVYVFSRMILLFSPFRLFQGSVSRT
jgi:hypothetical protein